MIKEIQNIILGGGNCYLLKTDNGCVLIDTGSAFKRNKLEQELQKAGCTPSNLNLIILTHGDFGHSGNAAYLRDKYKTKIAMHKADMPMVEHGDMFFHNSRSYSFFKKIINKIFSIRPFKPDLAICSSTDLSPYGLDAQVINLPGHSKGSIGIFTSRHLLFCGDLFTNRSKPEANPVADDPDSLYASIDTVKELKTKMVYPGHGHPFAMSSYNY